MATERLHTSKGTSCMAVDCLKNWEDVVQAEALRSLVGEEVDQENWALNAGP
jgi:hypothetical protein